MNARERILAAVENREAARADEKSRPAVPVQEPEDALRLLATPEEVRASVPQPPPVPVAPAPAAIKLTSHEAGPQGGNRVRLIAMGIGAAVVLTGAAVFLLSGHGSSNSSVSAHVSAPAATAASTPSAPAPLPAAAKVPQPTASAEASAPYVLTVRSDAPEPQQTPAQEQSASPQNTAEVQAPPRVFTPPPVQATPAASHEHVVLPEPTLAPPQISSSPIAASLPAGLAGAQQVTEAPAFKPVTRVVGGKVQPPVLIRKVAPEFPLTARASRTEGKVRCRAIIGPNGAVEKVQSVDGPVLLQGAAEHAIRQWKYRPALLDGKPVEIETIIEVDFRFGGQ